MAQDNYYRYLLYAGIVLLFADFLVVAWFMGTHDLPWWAYLALTLGTGFASADAILIGHELGHKASRIDRTPRRSSTAWWVTATSASSTTVVITSGRNSRGLRQRTHGREHLQVRAA